MFSRRPDQRFNRGRVAVPASANATLARLGILLTGQSVQTSAEEAGNPDPGPFPTGKRWRPSGGGAFVPYDSLTGVKDLGLVRALEAAGVVNTLRVNVAIGGTSSESWTPAAGTSYTAMDATLDLVLAALPAELDGEAIRWVHLHDQGEFEVTSPNGALAAAWAANFALLSAAIDAKLGQSMHHIITWTKIPQPTNNWPDVVRAQQTAAAVDAAHIIDRDALDYSGDDIHLTFPARAIYGGMQGAKILELLY